MTYIALKRQRFGQVHLDVGDEVPHDENRNYNLMERMGLVADVDKKINSETAAKSAQKAAKERIKKLESLLEDAREEVKALRAENADFRAQLVGTAEAPADEAEPGSDQEQEPPEAEAEGTAPSQVVLEELTNAQLHELAEQAGVEVSKRATKPALIEALSAKNAEAPADED
jgi:hypothetical protein